MLAGVGCVQHTQALEVFVISQALEGGASGQLLFAKCLERAGRHLAWEETRANGIDRDVVLAPFGAQCAGEVDHGALGGVVGNGVEAFGVAVEAGNGCNVDDASLAAGNHALFGDHLAEQEVAAHIEVHYLVPGFHGVVFRGSTPRRTGVVHQNVHIAHALQGFVGEAVDFRVLGAIGGDPAGIDASGLQFGAGLLQVFRLAGAEHDFGASFAQRVGHLQAQSA